MEKLVVKGQHAQTDVQQIEAMAELTGVVLNGQRRICKLSGRSRVWRLWWGRDSRFTQSFSTWSLLAVFLRERAGSAGCLAGRGVELAVLKGYQVQSVLQQVEAMAWLAV